MTTFKTFYKIEVYNLLLSTTNEIIHCIPARQSIDDFANRFVAQVSHDHEPLDALQEFTLKIPDLMKLEYLKEMQVDLLAKYILDLQKSTMDCKLTQDNQLRITPLTHFQVYFVIGHDEFGDEITEERAFTIVRNNNTKHKLYTIRRMSK